MTSIVAIDLETTGLDSERDAIIEIGAVRFSGKRVEDEFSSLINPNRHIPEFITGLTGIDDAMVRQAPRLQEMLPELEAFVGNPPVLGHHNLFDLSFLLCNWSFANGVLILCITTAQVVRSLQEEKFLLQDDRYALYRAAVQYRLIPGVF